MRIRMGFWIVLLSMMIMLAGCTNIFIPVGIQDGVSVIRYMMHPTQLSQSVFSVAYPKGKPSQFVSFLFSDMGKREFPPREDQVRHDPQLRAELARRGIPLVPTNLRYYPLKPGNKRMNMVVLKYDDKRNLVIVEGYESPIKPPVVKEKIRLLPAKPMNSVSAKYKTLMKQHLSKQAKLDDKAFFP